MVPDDTEASLEPVNCQLRRSFRSRDGIALIVSSVVGVGIFSTPAMIAGLVPHPIAMLALWLVGGAIALAGAISYARLARLWPKAGGEYVYLSKTYGPTAGFLSGWTSLIAGFSGSVAASAVAAVAFASRYFPRLSSDKVLATQGVFGFSITISPATLAAAALIAFFAVLHMRGLSAGKKAQNVLALFLVAMIAAFVAGGFATGNGSWSHFHSHSVSFGAKNWLTALIPIMFTFSGWNAATYVSEEVHASRRTMRSILLCGTVIVTLLYTALNVLYLYAIPVGQMSNSFNVAEAAAHGLFGAKSNFITPVLIVAMLGAISAMTIAGPRVYFAMARDGAFIPVFARTSPRFGTPTFAIALQAVWSISLVLLGGFDHILMYTGFAIVLSSGAAVAGLLLREPRGQTAPERQRTKLVAPVVFVIACAVMVLDTILSAPNVALVGVLLIMAGIPVYALCRRSTRSSTPSGALQPKEVAAD